MPYHPINPQAFRDDPRASWINLGLWSSDLQGEEYPYSAACRRLAMAVGDLALNLDPQPPQVSRRPGVTVYDCGCGRGDSVLLWLDHHWAASVDTVVGLNIDPGETRDAQALLEAHGPPTPKAVIHLGDAVRWRPRPAHDGEAAVVAVDCAYHFDTRKAWLCQWLRTPRVRVIACADILMSHRVALTGAPRQSSLWGRLLQPFRHLGQQVGLRFIGAAAGVPRDNLSYSSDELRDWLTSQGARRVEVRAVTEHVFAPFAQFAWRRRSEFGVLTPEYWALVSASVFMRWLAWSRLVEFVLYRVEL